MSVKLTPAQKLLLDDVNEKGRVTVSDTYKPGKKLIDAKLVDYNYELFGRVTLSRRDYDAQQ